ncbi:neuropeptide Y receptor-like [Brachionus plicatilis]|uniref:Neuropeptide Y receptor-like n=1 Tax=Brachionus plicatilis TaxID=10195 RepID=A0A3M7SA18_BRAPC|nr:neuropeptide Y receptor-like [Brachionus plicatilis]
MNESLFRDQIKKLSLKASKVLLNLDERLKFVMSLLFTINLFLLLGPTNCQIRQSNQTLEEQIVESQVPLYLKILASIFYTISMVLGIGGNAFVLLIFMFYQRVKTVTNFFIINLAINDLIFALLCIPSTFITAYLIQYWPMPQFMCVSLNFMQNASVTLTVYTLIWITLDKFWALVKPLKARISITLCKYLILVSWLFSLVISLPIAMFTRLTSVNSSHSKPQCSEIWPQSLEQMSTLYNVLLLLIQYFIPLIILTYCYVRIGLGLKRSKAPGETDLNRDARMTKSKQKIYIICKAWAN